MTENKDIEKSFIGAVLFASKYFYQVEGIISPEMIYDSLYRKIYKGLISFYSEHEKRDFTLIASQIDETEINATYLRQLCSDVNYSNVLDYAGKIKDSYQKSIALSILDEAKIEIETDPLENVFSRLDDRFKNLCENKEDKNAHISASINQIIDYTQRAKDHQGISGIDTGFNDFNYVTGGFQEGDQIIIAARPGMGKTTLMLNHLLHVARQGAPCVLFTMEMPKNQINLLLAAIETGISTEDLRAGRVTDQEMEKIEITCQSLKKLPIYIYDTVSRIEEMVPIIKHLKRKVGLRIVFVDYLQLIQGNEKINRNSQIENISGRLKRLASSENVTNVILAQLNRSVEARVDKRPFASDLRDSGAIEQDADILAFLYRASYYGLNEAFEEDLTEIIIRKNRMGQIYTLKRKFENRKFIEI